MSLVTVVQSQGGLVGQSNNEVGTSRLQKATCAFKDQDGTQDGGDIDLFGGSMYNLGNGSVLCHLQDDRVRLVCISVMKMQNSTDMYGNVTRNLMVSMQGW